MNGRKCFRGGRSAATIITVSLLACGLLSWLSAAGEPVAELKAAVALVKAGRNEAGVAALRSVAPRLSPIADYVAFFSASAAFDAGNNAETIAALDRVFRQTPVSPLIGRATLLASQAAQANNDIPRALDYLRRYARYLPQPAGDLETARALEASGDGLAAAVTYQNLYFRYPASKESSEAQEALTRLQTQLAGRYPTATTTVQLARALKLLDGGDAVRARRELTSLSPQLSGVERELVLVKIGVAGYVARDPAIARYLDTLTIASPEADAERLYYVFLSARRASDRAGMLGTLADLSRRYPASKWRMEALIQMAALQMTDNKFDEAEPLYRTCFEEFSKETKTAGCHWKLTWSRYLRRSPDAGDLLREQVRLFPDSDDAPAALYYLGRMAQEAGDGISAATYYQLIARQYPNRYYAIPSRMRLGETGNGGTGSGGINAANVFLQGIPFTTRARVRDFLPNPTARLRLERARLLAAADLDDWWPVELRYAADKEDQPHVMAMELARMENRRSNFGQALRYIKHYVPDYLSMSFESAPAEFWRLAFPLPFRADLERNAREQGLDPLLVAALLRQESEFDAKAVSSSNARGLAQIMPATGRDLSRRLKLKPYTTAHLFQPQTSLRLGTYYLKTISDKFDGRWESVLAAYNAGPSRASKWNTWADFREPSEFIETVPLQQTRDYIQIILRNAEIYRRVYPKSTAALDSDRADGTRTRATGAR